MAARNRTDKTQVVSARDRIAQRGLPTQPVAPAMQMFIVITVIGVGVWIYTKEVLRSLRSLNRPLACLFCFR